MRKIPISKIKKVALIAAPLPYLFLRYCLHVLSSRKLFSNCIHDFSQLIVFSPQLRSLPGMTTASERAYFQWYAQHCYSCAGVIVDLGCWLGSTTIPLAIGLEKNKKIRSKVRVLHAYDEFIWRPYMAVGVKGTNLEGKLQPGESFIQEFTSRIAPWKRQIVVHQGDLSQIKWEGGIIEFLLIDAMKSWDLTNNVIKSFFPALMPGVSLILHQDFAHWFTPWIHLVNYRLKEFFQLVYEVPRSGSVVLKLVKSIPQEILSESFSFSSFSRAEVDAAFGHSFSLVSKEKYSDIAAAKVMFFLHAGDLVSAREELRKCRESELNFDSDLSVVEARLFSKERDNPLQ